MRTGSPQIICNVSQDYQDWRKIAYADSDEAERASQQARTTGKGADFDVALASHHAAVQTHMKAAKQARKEGLGAQAEAHSGEIEYHKGMMRKGGF